MKNTKQYHIMEMAHAKDGLGISGSAPKDKNKILSTGSFEECAAKKKEFLENPQLIKAIKAEREKKEEKVINKLIKKHKNK